MAYLHSGGRDSKRDSVDSNAHFQLTSLQRPSKERPHQQEVDFADDGVLQVIAVLVILKLDVQAVLNPHLHLHKDMHSRFWHTLYI